MKATALVAWNLRRLRVKRALSQEALAVDAGVDRSYVGRIERGVENPTVETLDRLAAALDVAVAELLLAPKQGEKPPATGRIPSTSKKCSSTSAFRTNSRPPANRKPPPVLNAVSAISGAPARHSATVTGETGMSGRNGSGSRE